MPSETVLIGWFRPPRGHWEEFCRAPTESQCWEKLLDLAESGDKAVLPAGRHPDEPRQRGLYA